MPNGRGVEFETMDDNTLLAAMTPPISSAIHACYYRILGQSSVPWNIKPVERFIQLNAEGKGRFFGELVPVIVNDRVHVWLWKNCDVSDGNGITYNVYVWGLVDGKNCVLTRKYWVKAYVIRSKIESKLALQPMSLRLREHIL